MITKVINLNLHQPIYERLTAKQGDIASRYLLFHLLDGDKPFDLSNRTVRVYAIKPDKTEIFNDLTINDASKGYCTLELTSQCLASAGVVKMELYISESGKVLTSIPFELDVIACINTANGVASTNEFSALEVALGSLQDYYNLRSEIVQARKGHETVGERLDNFDSQKADYEKVKNKYYDVEQDLITDNNLSNITFKRKHSRNLYKNVKYHMCGMDFTRDFLNAENGNMYPQQNYLTSDYGTLLTETVSDFKYKLRNDTNSGETSKRLIGCINLFSTYEIKVEDIVTNSDLGVRCGIDIRNSIDMDKYDIFVAFTRNKTLEIRSEMFIKDVPQGVNVLYTENFTDDKANILFTITDEFIEAYKKKDGNITFLCKIYLTRRLNAIKTLADTKVNLFTRLDKNESVSYSYVENYYDCGVSQGDIKPIKYKDGSTLIKNGRVYFTMSSRFQESAYQTVISQNLSGCDYKLEGIILYTTDGLTINRDFASSIKYDNDSGKFLIWNASFTDRHCLSFGEAYCDIMHGINIVSMTPMSGGLVNDTDFKAKDQDEDPDFIYNYDTKKWYIIICRMTYDSTDNKNQYRYFLFESDNPFSNYVFKDKTLTGENTGGSIVKVGNKLYLVCGSNYHTTSQYNVYNLNDLSSYIALKKDYADGGYRGWGTIFSIPCGNFTKYGWITFDRDSVTDYKWSYGNIYYYESDLLNEGCEYNIKYSY